MKTPGLVLLLACPSFLLHAQTSYNPGDAAFLASARCPGGNLIPAVHAFTNSMTWYSAGGYCEWNGSHTSITTNWYDNVGNTTPCLWKDGALVSCQSAPSDTLWSDFTWSGLDSAPHLWRVANVNIATAMSGGDPANAYNFLSKITVSGGTGLTGVKPAQRSAVYATGDSLVDGRSTVGLTSYLQMDFWLAAETLGMYSQAAGYSGLPFNTTTNGTNNIITKSTTQFMPDWVEAPSVFIACCGSYNDYNSSVTLGTPGVGCTVGTFQCDVYNYYTSIFGLSKAPQHVLVQNIPQPVGTTAAWNVANVKPPVVQWQADNPASASKICYMDLVGMWGTEDLQSSDHLHPTPAAIVKKANVEQPVIAGYLQGQSYSVSCVIPSLLYPTDQVPCTVTLGGGASYVNPSGTETFTMGHTLSDGVHGGKFIPSVGSPFTSSGTVTPTSGTSWTFTYAPARSGSIPLSFGNQQTCWTDPSAVTLNSAPLFAFPPNIILY